jgi:hypothetical protein
MAGTSPAMTEEKEGCVAGDSAALSAERQWRFDWAEKMVIPTGFEPVTLRLGI